MLFSWYIARNSRCPGTTNVNDIHFLMKKECSTCWMISLIITSPSHNLFLCNFNLPSVIFTSNLGHHQDEKVYFGWYKIKLVLEVGLQKSAMSGCIITIQSFCILLACFYTSLQLGLLGFAFIEYLRDEQVYHYAHSICLSNPPPPPPHPHPSFPSLLIAKCFAWAKQLSRSSWP